MPVVSNHDERRKKKKKQLYNLICYVHQSVLKIFDISSKKILCNRNLRFSNLVVSNCNIRLLHSFLPFKADI